MLRILSQYVSSIDPIFGTPLEGTGEIEPNLGGDGGGDEKEQSLPLSDALGATSVLRGTRCCLARPGMLLSGGSGSCAI